MSHRHRHHHIIEHIYKHTKLYTNKHSRTYSLFNSIFQRHHEKLFDNYFSMTQLESLYTFFFLSNSYNFTVFDIFFRLLYSRSAIYIVMLVGWSDIDSQSIYFFVFIYCLSDGNYRYIHLQVWQTNKNSAPAKTTKRKTWIFFWLIFGKFWSLIQATNTLPALNRSCTQERLLNDCTRLYWYGTTHLIIRFP